MTRIRPALRFLALLFATFGIYGVWFVGRVVIPNRIYWRQKAFELWARAFVRIAGTTIEIIGTPPTPPFFLVSNHVSYFDIPVLRAAVPGVFVAKKEISGWFAVGQMVRNMGSIYVDRQNKRDIPRAGKEVIDRLNGGEGVIVFPEGTSTKGESVLPFSSSFLAFAAKTDTPVSYVSLTYRTPEGELPPSAAVCWWDDTGFLPHMLRMFSVSGMTAILNFGESPIVEPDRKKLAAALHQRVTEKFIPML